MSPLPRGSLAAIALSVVLAAASTPASQGANWLLPRHDAAGRNFNAAERTITSRSVGRLHRVWVASTGRGAIVNGPVVWHGRVYVSHTSDVACFRLRDGALLWRRPHGGTLSLHAGVLYAGYEDDLGGGRYRGVIWARNATSGRAIWRGVTPISNSSRYITGPVIARRGIVYAASVFWTVSGEHDSVIAYDASTGRELWRHVGGGRGLLLGRRRLYTTNVDGSVTILRPGSGALVARKTQTATAAVVARRRLFGFEAAMLQAWPLPLCRTPCAPRWQASTEEPDGIAYAKGTVFVSDYAGAVRALDARTGAQRWSATAEGPSWLIAAGPLIFVVTNQFDQSTQRLAAYPRRCSETCSPLWKSRPIRLNAPGIVSPVVVDDTLLYVNGGLRRLVALRP